MALTGASCLHRSVAVSELSQAGQVRRAIEAEIKLGGFDPTQQGKAAIVGTEIATNIARHTQGGEVLYRLLSQGEGAAVEILGIDRGPGMRDAERCFQDGYSTRSTPGNGLGAIRRQSEAFDVHSTLEGGTVIWSRISAQRPAAASQSPLFQGGGVCVAYPGEPVCGDAWRIHQREDGYAVMVADGLGHGVLANDAAEAAANAFDANPYLPAGDLIDRMHRAMQGSRGGTIAVARFDARSERLSYSGVGNISGRLLVGLESRGLISVNGTAGANVGRIQQFEYDCPAGATLVMHSDGLQSRWNLGAYPGLLLRHPAILAATLYRDYPRGRDDIAVVGARWERTATAGGGGA